jgi:hypothetical protein
MLLKNAGAAPFLFLRTARASWQNVSKASRREHLAGPARTGKAAVRFGRTWAISPAGLEAYLATPRRPGPKPRTKKAG